MPLPMLQKKEKFSAPRHLIAVAAGKGGVGKSTVTVNLSLALQSLGYAVGIMDADVYGPSIPTMLPEERLPSQKGKILIPARCRGIQVMSIAYFCREYDAVVARAPIANGMITQFIHNVAWKDLDYLLIDFPPGTGDVQLTLSQHANLTGAVMVTTPQNVAINDVRKAIHLFEQVCVPVLGIVENMSGYHHEGEELYPFGKGGGETLAKEKKIPFLGRIPLDPELSRRSDSGQSIFDCREKSPSVNAFLQLAENVVGQTYALTDAKSSSFDLIWKEKPTTLFNMEQTVTRKMGPLSIDQIRQKDACTFTILWSDGNVKNYRLSDLQKQCPCAQCARKSKDTANTHSEDGVKATRIQNVGRYALRVMFTSGCSQGIYSFDMLRNFN